VWEPYLGWHDRLNALINHVGQTAVVCDKTEIAAIALRVVRTPETLLLSCGEKFRALLF